MSFSQDSRCTQCSLGFLCTNRPFNQSKQAPLIQHGVAFSGLNSCSTCSSYSRTNSELKSPKCFPFSTPYGFIHVHQCHDRLEGNCIDLFESGDGLWRSLSHVHKQPNLGNGCICSPFYEFLEKRYWSHKITRNSFLKGKSIVDIFCKEPFPHELYQGMDITLQSDVKQACLNGWHCLASLMLGVC